MRSKHRDARSRNPRRSNRSPRRTIRPAIEALEFRTLLSNVSWTGQGDGTSWTDASNWSDDRVPGASDDVTIDLSGDPTIQITSGDQSIHSLTLTDSLNVGGGSLSVTSGLTMTGGSLTASGTGVTIVVAGTTTVTGGSLSAQGGATVSLPSLTTYTGGVNFADMLQASGARSVLNLPNLTNLTETNSNDNSITQIQALSGGDVELPGLTQLTGGPLQLESDGSGSVLDIGGVTRFQQTSGLNSYNSSLQATDGGTVDDAKLTTLTDVNLTLDGTGTIATDQIATYTADAYTFGVFSLTGGSLDLKGLTNDQGASFEVSSGGSLTLPQSSYTGGVNLADTFQASGAGSVLNLPNLTNLTETNNNDNSLTYIRAIAGGDVELPGLTQLTGGPLELESDGSGSVLDIRGVTRFQQTNGQNSYQSSLQVTDDGTVDDAKLTSLEGIAVILDGTGTIATGQITTFTGGSLTVNGGTFSVSGLDDADNSTFTITGGAALTLTGVTRANSGTIEVYGGASLSLPALTSADVVNMTIHGGATVALPSAADFTASGTTIAFIPDGSSMTIGSGVLSVPGPGSGVTIDVPQFPQGVTLDLQFNGTYSGGTTFNVAAQGPFVEIDGGTFTGGVTFNVGTGAIVDLTARGTVGYAGLLTGSGGGTVQFSGGSLPIGTGGLTLDFAGDQFQWTGGTFDGSLGNVTNQGTLNLSGPGDKAIFDGGTLFNYGTMIQTGAGYLILHGLEQSPSTLNIEPGATYRIESDAGITTDFGTGSEVDNAGTIEKTAGTGTSLFDLANSLNNTGTIEADAGTLQLEVASFGQISGGTLTGGTWDALNGASLLLGTTVATNAATVALAGAGATIDALAGLSTNSGSLSLTDGASLTLTGRLTNSGNLTVGAGSTLSVPRFTQTSTGSLGIQIGGTPASGQYGQVSLTSTAALGGNLNVRLVGGFNPSLGQDYPVISYAGTTGSFAQVMGLPSGMTATQTATALDLDMPSAGADLGLTGVSAPASAAVGRPITVNWQAKDQSATAASGSWEDSVFLSPTPSITSSAILLGTVPHGGGLAAGASYGGSLTAPVPALAPGAWYVLVQVDSLDQVADPNRANNTLAATGVLQVSLPSLTLGTPLTGSFTAAEQENYYQVTVPAGGSLVISAASAASSGALAVYVSQGTLPTPYNDQEASAIPNQPSQTAVVPQVLTAGTYNILVESISGAAATAGYTLTVTQGNTTTISAVSPKSGGNAGNVTVEIDGTNLATTDTASLVLGSTTINASAIDFVSASRIYATFSLSGAAAGNYS
jgi:hypothetical protein